MSTRRKFICFNTHTTELTKVQGILQNCLFGSWGIGDACGRCCSAARILLRTLSPDVGGMATMPSRSRRASVPRCAAAMPLAQAPHMIAVAAPPAAARTEDHAFTAALAAA
jgi:hypothetical protein